MKQKSNEELYEVIRQGGCDEKRAASSQLTTRGGSIIFLKAVEFCISSNSSIRAEGAFILGQLGTPERPFREESTPLLIDLLEKDQDDSVRASAAAALGHLRDSLAIPHLIRSAGDRSAEVRFDTAFALGCFNSPDVIASLITLSIDPDDDVRNWATFGIGTCLDIDTNEIREALVARLSEDDSEIRGEALIGLAKRKDERVIEPLIRELSGEFFGSWCIEAAELMSDPIFYPFLLSLRDRIEREVESRFISQLDDAIAACSQRSPDGASQNPG